MEHAKFVRLFLCLGFLLVLCGCSIATGAYMSPQSHFDFPNSNVIPIGHVSGEAAATGFYPMFMDADLKQEVIRNALQQKGGDILIDATYYYDIKSILILPFYTTTLKVEGTACKMELGKQELK